MGLLFLLFVLGSIPACAGEPSRCLTSWRQPRVYPRMRGGALFLLFVLVSALGLSPHARGSPRGARHHSPHHGSIPACAGEPSLGSSCWSGWRVYPRMRGGAIAMRLARQSKGGLSPHARGSLNMDSQSVSMRGSIPACAGEPQRLGRRRPRFRVYPRMRGGAAMENLGPSAAQGLSPHARGSRLARGGRQRHLGSIPACAGEPAGRTHRQSLLGVYPRMRGGAGGSGTFLPEDDGLSPHARGSLAASGTETILSRSIPACAGEPRAGPTSGSGAWVYPRMRGGAVSKSDGVLSYRGLSPHARGSP